MASRSRNDRLIDRLRELQSSSPDVEAAAVRDLLAISAVLPQ